MSYVSFEENALKIAKLLSKSKGKTVEEIKKLNFLEYISIEGISYYLNAGVKSGFIIEETRKKDGELIYFSNIKKYSKDEKLVVKSFKNLGYNLVDNIQTKSDLILEITDLKGFIQESKDEIEKHNEYVKTAEKLLTLYLEVENEYEKEVLRELNPNRTIY